MTENKRYKILIAEDNPINVKVAQFTLKSIAECFDVAKNGQEVVEMVKVNDYDVILMDVKMPIMDGYQATKLIREYEKVESKLPLRIIAITANNQSEEVEKCKQIGMDDFLPKPFTTEDALAVIENIYE